MAGPGNILIKVGADAGQAVRELSTLNSSLGDTMTASQKMGVGLKKAALPAAAALTAIGIAAFDATKAAAEDAAAQAHLAGVLERVAGASTAQVAATEDWIAGVSRATGVADDELRPALEKIVGATHDVGQAQQFLQQAMDISAASGKDLETVSAAIAKAYTGQTSSLEKLVPGLSKASKESDDFNKIMGELADTTGGAMAKQADTATGQLKILQNQTAELKESLGTALLPVMRSLIGVLNKLADFASENTTAIKVLVGAVAVLSAGILVANAALKAYEAIQLAVKVATAAWTAAQWLLNAALDANPIGLVIIAVAALATGLVIAYQKSETFKKIVDDALNTVKVAAQALDRAFDGVLSAAKAAFNWITENWKVAKFFFGPIAVAVTAIYQNFDSIKSAAKAAYDFITDNWKIAKFAFGPIESAVNAIASAFSAITNAVSSAIHAVESLIDALGRIKVPSLKLPHIPGLNVGPAPLPPALARARAGALAAPAPVTIINVNGALDAEGVARQIRRLLNMHDRRMGRAP